MSRIGQGLLVLLGVECDDAAASCDWYAEKTAHLRVFADADGRMNRSVLDVRGEALVVSQFTLAADTRRGRRPSYAAAASPEIAESLYERFGERLRDLGVPVSAGVFQAMMEVELVNDGPVTILLDPPPGART